MIIGYSTDGVWPLLAGKKYIAYEHGTIRAIPFQDDLQGRICKMVYQKADGAIISNFDNNIAAEKLGLKNYVCIPHYINEMDVPEELGQRLRNKLMKDYDADFILYNPSRQHWSAQKDGGWEKGNDILIRGFSEFVKKVNPKALCVFTEWGESLKQSKALIAELGIEDRVVWIDPVPHKKMIEYIQASHVVSDQFLLGTFGGIPAKAFMHGRPVLSAFDQKIHQWCFDTMPPFLESSSVQQIKTSLERLYTDADFYTSISEKSIDWYFNQHSNSILLKRMSNLITKTVL